MGVSVRPVAPDELPSFDLVVATVDRADQLSRLLDSLDVQTHSAFRVLLVDQNDDDRLDDVLAGHPALKLIRLRSARGLSRARNAALGQLGADIVAFPDDDCVFAPDLLERVARELLTAPELDGITGRAVGTDGQSSPSWAADQGLLTRENLWNRAISFTIFLRRAVVERAGSFDERLGLGSDGPSSSGEETEYLVRALDADARIKYDPSLVVTHEEKALSPAALRSVGAREGASIGYILRKHRYPLGTVARMFLRPLCGAVLAAVGRDPARVRFHLATFRGRVLGYRS
jgi:glycosyltransferase involved in cell wall biosynthesis